MKLTPRLPDDRRAHAEGRLRANLTASVTTVRPDGRPGSVPAWFLLRDDETILICSQPAKIKLRNISRNPAVAPGLDEERCERRRPRGRPCRRPPLRNDLEPARVVEADADCSVRPPGASHRQPVDSWSPTRHTVGDGLSAAVLRRPCVTRHSHCPGRLAAECDCRKNLGCDIA